MEKSKSKAERRRIKKLKNLANRAIRRNEKDFIKRLMRVNPGCGMGN